MKAFKRWWCKDGGGIPYEDDGDLNWEHYKEHEETWRAALEWAKGERILCVEKDGSVSISKSILVQPIDEELNS